MSENDLKIKSWFLAFAKDPLQLYNSNNSVLETQIDQNLAKIKWGILNRQPCICKIECNVFCEDQVMLLEKKFFQCLSLLDQVVAKENLYEMYSNGTKD